MYAKMLLYNIVKLVKHQGPFLPKNRVEKYEIETIIIIIKKRNNRKKNRSQMKRPIKLAPPLAVLGSGGRTKASWNKLVPEFDYPNAVIGVWC